ncbi:hypothetical protein [Anabaena sp. CCY 9402-a]|uniref:hypothetical protein n=1 Tax=Anabaena sp. CCY 9402-a TaxID=3103867 RepID=UPI0039C5ED17
MKYQEIICSDVPYKQLLWDRYIFSCFPEFKIPFENQAIVVKIGLLSAGKLGIKKFLCLVVVNSVLCQKLA